MKKITAEELTNVLENLIQEFTELEAIVKSQPEAEQASDDEEGTDESSPTNLSAPVAAAHIIEGALNYLIEQNAFPTPEQMHVLTELRTLELSYKD